MSTLNVTNIKAADGTTGLSIANSTGIVSFGNAVSGNTPCFYATFSTNLNNQSNNVAVKVPFNATTFNQGGGTFDTSNYRYTPGVAGVYMFGATVNMKDSGDNSNYQQQDVNIRKNGTEVFGNRIQLSASYFQASAHNTPLTVTGLVQMDTNDYVEVWASIYGGDFDLRPERSRFYGFKLIGTV